MNLGRIFKSFCSLSVLTMLSRASGFVKVAALAAFYGRSVEADMLTAVMILPDLVYKFLSEGLISGAAVPIFVKAQKDRRQLKVYFWSIFWVTAFTGMVISVFLALRTGFLCSLLMPGISSELEPILHKMWIFLIPYLTLGLLSGVQISFLNASLNFAKPALGSLIVNLSIIVGTFISAGASIESIALANSIGAVLQLIWLFWLIKKENIFSFSIRNIFIFDTAVVKKFIVSTAPVVAWVSILPLIPVYERRLLSYSQGGISTLNYTEKLFNLPLGIISISLAQVILPALSSLDGKERRRFLAKTLLISGAVTLPVIGAIFVLSEDIVKMVFMRGKFSMEDVDAAAKLFKFYIVALLPVSLNMVLNRGFFASGCFKIPFVAGLVSAFLQLYLCYRLVPAYGLEGIAIAAFTAGFLQLAILLSMESRIKGTAS